MEATVGEGGGIATPERTLLPGSAFLSVSGVVRCPGSHRIRKVKRLEGTRETSGPCSLWACGWTLHNRPTLFHLTNGREKHKAMENNLGGGHLITPSAFSDAIRACLFHVEPISPCSVLCRGQPSSLRLPLPTLSRQLLRWKHICRSLSPEGLSLLLFWARSD